MNATELSSKPGNARAGGGGVLILVVCLAQFMVILDVSIVNVALPSMRTGLHFSQAGLQWVVNAYTLTFAGFLMLGGRAGDLLGRRRVVILGARVLVEGRRVDIDRHFDLAGAVLVTLGLVGVTFGIVRSEASGWGSGQVLLPIAAGVLLLALFLLVEGRFARVPLVPISIFRLPTLRAANLIVVLMYGALFSMWFFLTLYLQQVLHYDAIEAGLAFVPMTLGVAVSSTLAPRMIARASVRVVLTGGMLCASTGMVLLTAVRPSGSYLLEVLPGGMLCTLGMGTSLVAGTIAAVQGVPPAQSGLASGLLNTSRLVGGALGLAILGTLADSYTRGQLHAAVPALRALTDGYQLAFAVGAVFCLVGAVAAAVLLAPRRALAQAEEEDEPVEVVAA